MQIYETWFGMDPLEVRQFGSTPVWFIDGWRGGEIAEVGTTELNEPPIWRRGGRRDGAWSDRTVTTMDWRLTAKKDLRNRAGDWAGDGAISNFTENTKTFPDRFLVFLATVPGDKKKIGAHHWSYGRRNVRLQKDSKKSNNLLIFIIKTKGN